MRRILPSTAAILALVTPALAQVAIPDTIVTATGVPTALERVPASITVINRRMIEENGFANLAEALASVPGLRVAQSGGPGQQASVFMRGNSSRSTLVLMDGVPVNDPSDANGAFNFGNETLFDIERIEVLRGPASSLYGSAAIGGVINLVTRRAPADRTVMPYGEVAGGSQNTLRLGGGVAGTVGAFDYLASLNNISTQASNATASRFFRTLGERDGFNSTNATARLGYTPIEGTRLEGLVRWRENRIGIDSVPRDDPNYTGDDRRWLGQIRGESRLFDGVWTTGLRLAVTQDRRTYSNLPDILSAARTQDYYSGTRQSVDWGNVVRLPSFGPATEGAVTFGVNYAHEDVTSYAGNVPFRSSVAAKQDTTAGHAAVQYRFWDRLDVTGGVRYDSVSSFVGYTSWRVGAVLAVPEANMRIRASGGTAFNAPSLNQRFGIIGNTFRGNPNLRPETSIGYEFGAEMDIPAFGQQRFSTVGFTFFQSRVTDLINFNAQFNSLTNVASANLKGVELVWALRPASWLTTEMAWTITDATDGQTGRVLPRRPESVVSALARIEPIAGLVITPQIYFTGRSPEGAFATYLNSGASVSSPRNNKSGTLFNLTASYRITPQITGFLEGRNLTDSKWEPVNGFQTPGRSAIIGTRFAF
ncbi:TonB-dependent receptor [Sediminicoccus sp. KRV36]|uniref:TonB-dependent receptor plug domain-containing protein n=1 Tax=Sediminicoccus sp. KRV36 TaxID=3133721 RepID=UPI00200F5737|nr:TonB-dependent receptor [Sediminicoccus rosea]UPY36831.1 TonB-dependent receptor [Sediminicoccus rosea]